MIAKLRAEGAADDVHGVGVGVPGPVELTRRRPVTPPIMPGWNRFPVARRPVARAAARPVLVDNDVNVMALGEHARRDSPRTSTTSCSSRSAPASAAGSCVDGEVYRGVEGAAGDIGHIRVVGPGAGLHLRQRGLPGGALRRGRAGARRRCGRPGGPFRACSRTGWRRRVGSPPRTSAAAAAPATRSPWSWSATAGGGSVWCSPAWSASSTPASS